MSKKKETIPSPSRGGLRVGDAVRIAREVNDLTQNQLAKKTGIPQATISGIESGSIKLGAERAKVLALALNVHPSVLLFSDWEEEKVRLKKSG